MDPAATEYEEGMRLLAERDKPAALVRFEVALKSSPGHAGAAIERAYLVLETQEWDSALAAMEQARDAAAAGLGDLSRWTGRFWDALETRPYLRALHGIGVCHMKAGRRAEATAAFGKVLQLCPRDPVGARILIDDMERKGMGPKGARR